MNLHTGPKMTSQKQLIFLSLLLIFSIQLWGQDPSFNRTSLSIQTTYIFPNEPIDVVIPCTEKDLATLELCIKGVKDNVMGLRRIIIISNHQLTSQAEWFDESHFPFSKYDIAFEILKHKERANFYSTHPSRLGWIYQQFLKFYAAFVIPHISSNVLIVDADTIFLNPVTFIGLNGAGLYNPGSEKHPPYFEHMKKLIPGLRRVYPDYSGVVHHMLFQKVVLEDLFAMIEDFHGISPWQALCRCIDPNEFNRSSMSEFEIYFNFVFTRTKQVKIRKLSWGNSGYINKLENYKANGIHYVSCHSYIRK